MIENRYKLRLLLRSAEKKENESSESDNLSGDELCDELQNNNFYEVTVELFLLHQNLTCSIEFHWADDWLKRSCIYAADEEIEINRYFHD
jgi:hypothetical protein